MRERRYIIRGQKVVPAIAQRARELRKQMTPEEEILWNALRTNRLSGFHFRRQQVIDGFIADFYCHAASLVIEIDGGVHDQQVDHDLERDRIIAARGLEVLRFPNESIKNELPGVLHIVLMKCHERSS